MTRVSKINNQKSKKNQGNTYGSKNKNTSYRTEWNLWIQDRLDQQIVSYLFKTKFANSTRLRRALKKYGYTVQSTYTKSGYLRMWGMK